MAARQPGDAGPSRNNGGQRAGAGILQRGTVHFPRPCAQRSTSATGPMSSLGM